MRNRANDKNQGFTLNAKNCLTAAQTEFIELYAKNDTTIIGSETK